MTQENTHSSESNGAPAGEYGLNFSFSPSSVVSIPGYRDGVVVVAVNNSDMRLVYGFDPHSKNIYDPCLVKLKTQKHGAESIVFNYAGKFENGSISNLLSTVVRDNFSHTVVQ